MGIFSFLDRFKDKKNKTKLTKQAIASVKAAAQASNYNKASIKAFYALEEIGKVYANVEREISVTAREYRTLLVEEGRTQKEDIDPIIYNFEIAKYSPDEVTFEDYRKVEGALETVVEKLKIPAAKVSKGKAKKGKKSRKRRRPTKRATGARRRRTKK